MMVQSFKGILVAAVVTVTSVASSVASSAAVTVVDRTWLWAHPGGFHDNYFTHAPFNLTPAGTYRSRITPVEAALYMGLPNILFVYEQHATFTECNRGTQSTGLYPCYPDSKDQVDKYLVPFRSTYFKSSGFSVSGGGESYPDGYIDSIIAALPSIPSSTGLLFDDFVYDASHLLLLRNMSTRAAAVGKDIFLCVYTKELAELGPTGLKPYLELAKRPMLWMADDQEIVHLEQHWSSFETTLDAAGGREQFKPMLGLYMFNYLAGATEMPPDLMTTQLDVALNLLHAGRAHDVIFLGSPIVDLPLAAVNQSREWIATHGAEPINASHAHN